MGKALNVGLSKPRSWVILGGASLRKAGQIALDIGQEDRHTQVRKAFGQRLQGDGFAGAGGASDQVVAVGLVGGCHRLESMPWKSRNLL